MLIKLPFTVRRQNRIRNFLQLLLINMSISCCDSKSYCYVLGCSAKSFLTALVIHEDFFFVCVWARRSSADSWLIGFFSNHFQFKIICCSFKYWCRCKREREKDSQKIMISLRWDRAREKKSLKVTVGMNKKHHEKSYERQSLFFFAEIIPLVGAHTRNLISEIVRGRRTTGDEKRRAQNKKLHQR